MAVVITGDFRSWQSSPNHSLRGHSYIIGAGRAQWLARRCLACPEGGEPKWIGAKADLENHVGVGAWAPVLRAVPHERRA